jgi:hypothetical protein
LIGVAVAVFDSAAAELCVTVIATSAATVASAAAPRFVMVLCTFVLEAGPGTMIVCPARDIL